MHHRLLRILALAFVALVILQSLLGGALFFRSVGIGAEQIVSHYGDKSFHGLIEVLLPHALFIGIALMATLHFLAFIPTLGAGIKQFATHSLFLLFFLDQGSVLLVAAGWSIAAYLKIVAFIGFELLLGWVWYLIFRHTLKELV